MEIKIINIQYFHDNKLTILVLLTSPIKSGVVLEAKT